MTARPKVSIIIPAYNVEAYIAASVDSALAQTYPNVEVVVVDDGSTDATSEILTGYGDRIVVVTQANGGLAAARNSGLRAATGDIFGLLDGDDTWLPERLDRMVDLLESRPDLGLVTSDSWLMEDFTPTTKRSYPDRRRRPFPATEADQIPEIARFNFLFISVLLRRELVEECGMFLEHTRRGAEFQRHARVGGGPSIEGAEDYELWMRYLLAGTRAGFLDEPLGYYRVRSGSLSDAKKDQGRAHLAVLERHLPELWRQGARGYTRDIYTIASSLAARGERREAAVFFWHAMRGEGKQGSRVRQALSSIRRLVQPVPTWLED